LEGPQTEVAEAFEMAANDLLLNHPAEVKEKYPELIHWKIAADNAMNHT
jgi:hypothetical protein